MKLKLRDRIKLFRHGLKIAQSKNWFIVWDKKTGIPVNYSLPFVTEMNKDYENTIFHDWLDSIKVSDYCRPFMTEEDLFTTDLKKCRENAETIFWRKFLEGVKLETFTHDELKKVFDIVGDIIIAKENKK